MFVCVPRPPICPKYSDVVCTFTLYKTTRQFAHPKIVWVSVLGHKNIPFMIYVKIVQCAKAYLTLTLLKTKSPKAKVQCDSLSYSWKWKHLPWITLLRYRGKARRSNKHRITALTSTVTLTSSLDLIVVQNWLHFHQMVF